MRRALVLVGAILVGSPSGAAADPAVAGRAAHGSIGGGGFVGITGAGWGPVAVAAVYPGGRFGRYGVRGEVRGYRGVDPGQATLGLIFEAAAARPRLQLALYADAGLTWRDPDPVVGGGVETHLWLWGPIAVAAVAGASLRLDGTDSALSLIVSNQLRLAW